MAAPAAASTPLETLRACIVNRRPVSLAPEGDVLVLGNLRVPRGTLTNYKSATGGFYPLDVVWDFYEKREADHTSYVQAARLANIGFVSRADRVDLINYLSGEIATSAKIDASFVGDQDWLDLRAANLKRPVEDEASAAAARMGGSGTALATTDSTGAVSDATKRARLDPSQDKRRARAKSGEAAKDAGPVIDPATLAQFSHERRLRDRTTVLLSDKSFAFVYTVIREAQAKAAKASRAAPSSNASTSTSNRADDRQRLASSKGGVPRTPGSAAPIPIIVVPGSASPITLINIKEFMEESQFVDPVEKMKQTTNRDKEIIVKRPNAPDGQPKMFRVVDMPKRLKPSEWGDIICIFVTGREWQLKDYVEKWKTSAELFSNVLGIHVKYEDDKLEETVKNWNVTVLPINRFRRHLDSAAAEKFWQRMEQWIKVHRSNVY